MNRPECHGYSSSWKNMEPWRTGTPASAGRAHPAPLSTGARERVVRMVQESFDREHQRLELTRFGDAQIRSH